VKIVGKDYTWKKKNPDNEVDILNIFLGFKHDHQNYIHTKFMPIPENVFTEKL